LVPQVLDEVGDSIWIADVGEAHTSSFDVPGLEELDAGVAVGRAKSELDAAASGRARVSRDADDLVERKSFDRLGAEALDDAKYAPVGDDVMAVAVADACRGGWVSVVLDAGRFADSLFAASFAALLGSHTNAQAIDVLPRARS